jgi:hypothetical protein
MWEHNRMSNFKMVSQILLLLTSISLQFNSTVAVNTVRFLPDWNSVMEGMITIGTLPTALTNFIHSISKPGPNVIIKNKVKIMDNAQNNHYNAQLSYIHLAQSLWHVSRHAVYKELEKMKCELFFPQTSTSWSDMDGFWSVSNIRQPLPAHIQLCIQFPHSRSW